MACSIKNRGGHEASTPERLQRGRTLPIGIAGYRITQTVNLAWNTRQVLIEVAGNHGKIPPFCCSGRHQQSARSVHRIPALKKVAGVLETTVSDNIGLCPSGQGEAEQNYAKQLSHFQASECCKR